MNAKEIAEGLKKSKPHGSYWTACCPAHDDNKSSLSIADGVNDKGESIVLVKCHANCSQSEVIESLKKLNLWKGKPAMTSKPKIVETYDYTDANGKLLFQGVRYEPKDFRQRAPKPGGGWNWSLKGVELVPYNLPAIINTTTGIVIVEGERDANLLIRWGVAATTSPMGAGKWREEYNKYFKNKSVYIIPDNDKPGKDHANDIAKNLLNTAKLVKVVSLPGGVKSDLSEWAKSGGDKDKLISLIMSAPEYCNQKQPEQPTAKVVNIEDYRDEDAWPKPVDFFAKLTPPKLDTDLLPSALRDFIRDQSEVIGVDPGTIGISSLITCASAIHDQIQIQPKQHETGWTESARLWGAIVGDPSVKKSPGIKKSTGPLRKIDIDLAKGNAATMEDYRLEEQVYKKLQKSYVDSKVKAKENNREGGLSEKPTQLEHPTCERAIVEDSTIEALSEIMRYNPRGILCLRDELSGWFGGMDAYSGGKNKDRPLWLESYNGGARNIDRIQRGSFIVPNWSVCMLGGIQPEPLRAISANLEDDGLLQRFMVIMATESTAGVDRPIDEKASNDYKSLIKHIYDIVPTTEPIRLSQGAAQVRIALDKKIRELRATKELSMSLMSHIAKWEGLFPRLLLTYHVIECASKSIHPCCTVSEETAKNVYRFMLEYLLPHAVHFYVDVMSNVKHVNHATWLAEYILSRELDAITKRDIHRNYKSLRTAADWELLNAMNFLESSGWVRSTAIPGKKLTSWEVNPTVHRLFKERGDKERARRRETVKTIRELIEGDKKQPASD